ncbi:disease resistance protein RPV1-like isoform X2 [Nymphaea colorata]|uniref:disease resistance protein RPV1-like isoform X2 n=1 Tax=Nymphaea colorata TaxID=210225 RepID=UPI00129E1997|nr:disease resistance protein RPV1-like isoform X2 [Nymphaea colorata]
MDGITTLEASIIFIGLLLVMIRALAVGNNHSPVSPSDEGATELKGDVPSPPIGAASSSAHENDDKRFLYNAFLSFRGKDTRNRFVSHLYRALKQSNVSAFMDNRDLGKGEPIENLLKAIKESMILLPIFSKNYADSVWCLKEITEMVEVMKTDQSVDIVPIFFDVEPDDVRCWYRHSEGRFRSASADEKKKWRKALRKVTSIHGFTLKSNANGDEAELVDIIVEEVQSKLGKSPLHVAKYPIGMEGQVQEVRKLLKKDGQGVNMIALQGMPGIGKTTIAKAVYNELFHDFHGASTFISDVGEKFRKGEGVKCQEQLIYDIMGKEDRFKHSIGSTDAGINKIKETTRCRKVLVVLDDIDRVEQLQALAGARDWFGLGSVIIITTKDKSLLSKQDIEESQIYKPKLLDEEESFQFLVRHVLKGRQPTKKELDMLREIAKTAGGLPLAIEVLGPHLSCKRNMEVWRRELEKLKEIPVEDVESKLKISYDGLPDVEKEIFLDICCFFVGADCGRSTHYYWEACRFHSESAIKLLQDRSLISLDKQNRFHMHDLLRNMGREIVLRRSEVPPSWKLSRVWTTDDIFDLLERDEVPDCSKVTGIILNKEVEEGKELHKRVECFRNMHYLRLLHMEGINFKNNFHYFPKELLWLGLPRCSFESPPSGLNLRKLVILNLSNCNLASLSFFGDMVFEKLKVLDLSSTDLTRTPDFCNFRCLVDLTLRRCEKLTSVHRSIGELKSLVALDMRTCTLLEELPDTICNLGSIEVLHLGWCAKLSSLPEQIGNLRSLKELSLNDTAIRKVPASVGQLTCLSELPLQRCKWLGPLPDSLTGWFSSGKLKMFGTPLRMIGDEVDLSKEVEVRRVSSCMVLDFLSDKSCKAVREFYLTDHMVQEFPHSIIRLQNLDILSLKCDQLRALPAWVKGRRLEKLTELEIESKSLKNLPDTIESLEGLKTLKLVCENLESLPDAIEKLKGLEIFEFATGKLEQLPQWIGSLRSLRQLKVKCSRITAIPDSIKQLEGLEKLELQIDNPTALSDSTTLPKKLNKFSLSCKDLKSLPDCVWSLRELQELSLRGCSRIEAPPDAKLAQLENLLHLDLSQTGVNKIPESIRFLPKLRFLRIADHVVNGTISLWFEGPETTG